MAIESLDFVHNLFAIILIENNTQEDIAEKNIQSARGDRDRWVNK